MRFQLVDRITCLKKSESIEGIKNVSFSELPLNIKSNPRIPKVLVLESLMQLMSWCIVYSYDFKYSPLVVRIDKIIFHDDANIGSQLRMKASLISSQPEALLGEGCVFAGDKLILEAKDIMCCLTGLLFDQEDAKRRFELLLNKPSSHLI